MEEEVWDLPRRVEGLVESGILSCLGQQAITMHLPPGVP
jgi:hypothetical protein